METGEIEWTVLTWNLQGTRHTDLGRVADHITRASPDVIVLQEARREQAAALAAGLSMTSTWAEKHNPWRPFLPSRAEGAAILTPHTMSRTGHEEISTETSKRSYKRRIVQFATVERADASGYRIYNTHLSPHDMHDERVAEARRIAALVSAHGDVPPPVIAGDLNDHGEPEIIAELPGLEHLSAPVTNPSEDPYQALDHVVVPVDAFNVSVSVPAGGADWAALSDHLPLTVRFTMAWVQGGFAG